MKYFNDYPCSDDVRRQCQCGVRAAEELLRGRVLQGGEEVLHALGVALC